MVANYILTANQRECYKTGLLKYESRREPRSTKYNHKQVVIVTN